MSYHEEKGRNFPELGEAVKMAMLEEMLSGKVTASDGAKRLKRQIGSPQE